MTKSQIYVGSAIALHRLNLRMGGEEISLPVSHDEA